MKVWSYHATTSRTSMASGDTKCWLSTDWHTVYKVLNGHAPSYLCTSTASL